MLVRSKLLYLFRYIIYTTAQLAVTSLAGSIGTGIDSGSVKFFTEFIAHKKKSYTIVGVGKSYLLLLVFW